MISQILKGAWDYFGKSELLWMGAPKLLAVKLPHYMKLGYERRPKFQWLSHLNGPAPFPVINRITTVEAKIELHEAKRAGDHLDFRIKVGNRVYDFAVVKTKDFPTETGVLKRVVRTPNHSTRYFYTDGAVFPNNAYGEGEMATLWRGNLDIIWSNAEKVEFCIPEGPFKGRFCLRELPKGWVLLKMKSPAMPWKDRMNYTSVAKKVEQAYDNPEVLAEHKIDGANYMVIPGPKENVVISRRISVTGSPINRAENIPQLKYHQFPKEYHGKTLHCEIVAEKGSSSFTAGLLNSHPTNSRNTQHATGKHLTAYVWDIEGTDSYVERRMEASRLVHSVGRIDNRSLGRVGDRFFLRRVTNPKLMRVPVSNEDTGETPQQFAARLKAEGKEGVVLKDKTKGYYEDVWAKDKKIETYDFNIISCNEGSGKHRGRLGALVCSDPRTGAVTRVGTGFSDSQREWIWANRESVRGKMCCVATHELTENGIGRGPRFIGFHPESGVIIQDEQGLLDYAEGAAISPYQVKSAAGWRKK